MPLLSATGWPLQAHENWPVSPRVFLQTDAPLEALPAAIRSVAQDCWANNLPALDTVPADFNGALTWLHGEVLLEGSAALLRAAFRTTGRRIFFPVHRPGLPEMPLLAWEPRALTNGNSEDRLETAVRIGGPSSVSAQFQQLVKSCREPWAQLSAAMMDDLASPGAGIAALAALAAAEGESFWAVLAMRNLFVLLLRLQQSALAEKILAQALSRFPNYSELQYLAALWHLRAERPAAAFAAIEKARAAPSTWPGTGGENSYRLDWLLGILARRAGNERVAFAHLRRCLQGPPYFSPALQELLALRLPRKVVAQHQVDLTRSALAQPTLASAIFDFFLLHDLPRAAENLLAAVPLDEVTRNAWRQRLPAQNSFSCGRIASAQPAVLLCGPLFEHSSLARINRQLAASLEGQPGWTLALQPAALAACAPQQFPEAASFGAAFGRAPSNAALTIRHQWPPDFRRPPQGKLAVILPWEYGAVPQVWVAQINTAVDELWVPSAFVSAVLRRAGVQVPIEVLPNGFDPQVFRPDGPAARPQACRRCLLLFVGGPIRRKGLDVLLEAYGDAFAPADEVTLAVYVSGAGGSYQHNALLQELQSFAADPQRPHLQILADPLDDARLASLYRGCDALALPYRGEGFGMPLLEALACGKPVIATDAGPAPEFCPRTTTYWVSAHEVPVPDEAPPLGPLQGAFTWFEPDRRSLAKALREVYEKPADAARRGQAAARAVRKTYAWSAIMSGYQRRVAALLAHSVETSANSEIYSAEISAPSG